MICIMLPGVLTILQSDKMLFSRTLCSDENVLYLCCLAWQLLPTMVQRNKIIVNNSTTAYKYFLYVRYCSQHFMYIQVILTTHCEVGTIVKSQFTDEEAGREVKRFSKGHIATNQNGIQTLAVWLPLCSLCNVCLYHFPQSLKCI